MPDKNHSNPVVELIGDIMGPPESPVKPIESLKRALKLIDFPETNLDKRP